MAGKGHAVGDIILRRANDHLGEGRATAREQVRLIEAQINGGMKGQRLASFIRETLTREEAFLASPLLTPILKKTSALNPKAAEVEAGSEGLLFFPYLMGERSLGTPLARGVFFGLTPRIGTGAMVRAIMEGVTFELRRTLEIVEDAGNTVHEVYTIGGGARSDLWSQIKADIYQKPVYTFEASEGGILGSAILAGVGAGFYPDVRAGAEQCLRVDKEFQPDASKTARYDYLYELFKEVHDRMQEPFDKLVRMP